MLRRALPVWLVAAIVLAGCAVMGMPIPKFGLHGRADDGSLTVFAAASLNEAFTEMARVFEAAHPPTKVVLNFAGSQELAQQIESGAPADVFASAAPDQVESVIAAGKAKRGAEREFAENRLLVVFPPDNPAGIVALADLAKPGLRLILAAPGVPVGRYSLVFLDNASRQPELGPGFKAAVLRNVVSFEQSVRAVLTKVLIGEADAGIVYASDAASQEPTRLGRLTIADALNVPASYVIVPLEGSARAGGAAAFVALVLSPQGQRILANHGLLPVSR